MAPRHIGHGSHDVNISQPLRSNVPNTFDALRIADTSAWAVGSQSRVTLLDASATILPSRAMTAPKGPPPNFTLSSARRMALVMSSLLSIVYFLSFLLFSCCKDTNKFL